MGHTGPRKQGRAKSSLVRCKGDLVGTEVPKREDISDRALRQECEWASASARREIKREREERPGLESEVHKEKSTLLKFLNRDEKEKSIIFVIKNKRERSQGDRGRDEEGEESREEVKEKGDEPSRGRELFEIPCSTCSARHRCRTH